MCMLLVWVCVITYYTSPKCYFSAFRPSDQLYHHCDFRCWRYWWQWVFLTPSGLLLGFQVCLLGRILIYQFSFHEFYCHRNVQLLRVCLLRPHRLPLLLHSCYARSPGLFLQYHQLRSDQRVHSAWGVGFRVTNSLVNLLTNLQK